MKAVILAGGLGTRLSEETTSKPKPMVEIGGRPILWHIMKIYSCHGVNEFIICLGYKGYIIKKYFADYYLTNSDVTFDMAENKFDIHANKAEPWKVTLVDTGEKSLTGERIKRIADYLGDEEFCLTYGDGVGDVNITESIEFHKAQGRLATMTTATPPGRFGIIEVRDGKVTRFQEKPKDNNARINAGFFVLSPKVIDYIPKDRNVMWEAEPLIHLTADGELSAYHHAGFWQPMDTLSNKVHLEELWQSQKAPWKIW